MPFFCSKSQIVGFNVPTFDVDLGEDMTIIGHELGHAWHCAFLGGNIAYFVGNEFEGIAEGIAEYFGLSYRRSKSLFQPNKRSNWASSSDPRPLSVYNTDTLMFDSWDNIISFLSVEDFMFDYLREHLRFIYVSALMDLEYLDATNPELGVNLGRDITHRLLCQSMHYITQASDHVSNVLAMYQADIDLYDGAHLPQLIEVYTHRELFNQILTQMPASNRVNGIAMVNSGFEVPTNRTLTIDTLSYFVLNGNITVQPNATLVFNEQTRVFNPGNHTIYVYGTLQIAGNTKLPANIVVYNGGTLLINENIAFAKQPGTTITIKSGGKVESNGLGTLLNITDGWVLEQGTVFENLGNSNRNYGVILEPTTELTLLNTTFINTNVQGMGNFTFEECSFTCSDLTVIAEEISVDSCVFDSCTVSASVRSLNPTYAEIQNCSFLNGEGNYALQLSGYNEYNVLGNLIEDNGNGGISISNCGLLNPNDYLISDNVIQNNSGGEALRLYNSSAIITGNTIAGNSHGIGFYHNCLIKSFGDEEAPQTISYNGNVQVQAVDNSFPWYFSYNIIEANTTDTLINCFYNTDNGGTEEKYDVTMNCWASGFDPETQLIPFKNFLWSPTWDCFTIGTLNYNSPAEELMHEGYNALSNNNIPTAKQNFEQIIAQYPQSHFAKAALKSLRSIYHTQGYSLQDFMQYLNNETATSSSSELQKITGYFRAETNLSLGDNQSALDFYQSVIDNSDTPADEIYATIDAEYAGLDIGHKAVSINTFTKMLSKTEAHNKKRNMLLDGLKVNKTQDLENSVIEDIADFTVSPNPAKSFIDITFSTAPKGNTTINIVSIDGRTISSQTIRENSEELKIFRMMLPELNHGLYLISVTFENNLKTVKKVVVK